MTRSSIVLILLLFAAPASLSASHQDTLRYYLSRSGLVVLGTITSEPRGYILESGVPQYLCDFAVEEVLKGAESLKGSTMRINIARLEWSKEDHHPLIARDSRCIVFLNREPEGTTPVWKTADLWFGIQYPFPQLGKALKRLAAEK